MTDTIEPPEQYKLHVRMPLEMPHAQKWSHGTDLMREFVLKKAEPFYAMFSLLSRARLLDFGEDIKKRAPYHLSMYVHHDIERWPTDEDVVMVLSNKFGANNRHSVAFPTPEAVAFNAAFSYKPLLRLAVWGQKHSEYSDYKAEMSYLLFQRLERERIRQERIKYESGGVPRHITLTEELFDYVAVKK